MTRRWTLRLAACLVAGAAVLTGCSEKQEAAQTLPSSSSAAPTEDALPPLGPESFPVPAEAREQTPEGAVEFVRYYVGLTGHVAENSLDPEPLRDLSQDCRACLNIADSLAEDRASNRTYREYEFEFSESGPALLDGDTAEMGFTYVQGPVSVVDETGAVVTERSSGRSEEMQSGAVLRWRSDLNCWVLTGLTVG